MNHLEHACACLLAPHSWGGGLALCEYVDVPETIESDACQCSNRVKSSDKSAATPYSIAVPVRGHDWVEAPRASHIFCLGGYDLLKGQLFPMTHALVLDPKTQIFQRLKLTGDVPRATAHHKIVVVGLRTILLFGGLSVTSAPSLYALDIWTLTWKRPVVVGSEPARRAYHTFIDMDLDKLPNISKTDCTSCVMLIGGSSTESNAPSWDVHLLFIAQERYEWTKPRSSGRALSVRRSTR